MSEQIEYPTDHKIESLAVEKQSSRNRVIDTIFTFAWGKVRESKGRGLFIIKSIQRQFGEVGVILEHDIDKLIFNHWRVAGMLRLLNDIVNFEAIREGSRFLQEREVEQLILIYETIAGCFGNMAFVADAVIDEQNPSFDFAVYLLQACAQCVENPATFRDHYEGLPFFDPRYYKVKVALIYAYYTGVALQELEAWSHRNGRSQQFEASKRLFLETAHDLMQAEIESLELQRNPEMTSTKYENVSRRKSDNTVLALLNLVVPLTYQAMANKEVLIKTADRTTRVIRVPLIDDMIDLQRDLAKGIFSVSGYLMQEEGLEAQKQRFIELAHRASSLDADSKRPLVREMIRILWETETLPKILNKLTGKEYYQELKAEADRILKASSLKKEHQRILKIIINLLIEAQKLSVRHLKKKIPKLMEED